MISANSINAKLLLIFLIITACGIEAPAMAEDPAAEPARPSAADPSPQETPAGADRSAAGATKTDSSQAESFPSWFPRLLGAQWDGVFQKMPAFHSPYEGPNSLSFRRYGSDLTNSYGIYLGSQLAPNLQAYLDGEMFNGNGISQGIGLGGYVNGDVIRAGSSNLPKVPYLARAYFRYFYPLSSETEKLDRCMDQIPGEQPLRRWEVKFGKFALTDDLDNNRYADNNRSQFMNYDFLYNTAWDYASDTRGYSWGFVTALYQPLWRLAFGIMMEPNTPNGAFFDWVSSRELGYNLELSLKPNEAGTVIRVLSYFNEARMGNYDAALALASETHSTPDLLLVEKQGGTKYGLGLNFEQPLIDDGETGIFGRMGWNDGHYETWCYTESDRHASLGAQLSGVHWKRSDDRVGVAYGVNGLSTPHKDYLAAGGVGILLGDGNLNYGFEQVLEMYYRIQITPYLALSPDFQFIQNPGYNSDRGPVQVYGMRMRLSY